MSRMVFLNPFLFFSNTLVNLRDYIYAVTPLLEDALTDRDQVHRQLAANTTKNLALGVYGYGCEDALHLLNLCSRIFLKPLLMSSLQSSKLSTQ